MRFLPAACAIAASFCSGVPRSHAAGEPIVPRDSKLELLYTRADDVKGGLTEGPAVAPDGSIYFTDIRPAGEKGLILRFDPKTRRTEVFSDDSGKANGLMFNAKGLLVACEGSDGGGRRVSRWDVKAKVKETVADRFQGKRFTQRGRVSHTVGEVIPPPAA
jgi:gluconolactonase